MSKHKRIQPPARLTLRGQFVVGGLSLLGAWLGLRAFAYALVYIYSLTHPGFGA